MCINVNHLEASKLELGRALDPYLVASGGMNSPKLWLIW